MCRGILNNETQFSFAHEWISLVNTALLVNVNIQLLCATFAYVSYLPMQNQCNLTVSPGWIV